MKDKISVIIPAYNIEPYLARCLDSLLRQEYENLEIVVVNDGSTDGTGRLMDEYAAKHDRVIALHKPNGGVTSARLHGVANSTGTWIGFVDGDDYVEPDMYARLLNNALTHQAQISQCANQMVYPSGKIVPYYGTGKLLVQKDREGCAALLDGKFIEPGVGNKMFRRELFEGLTDWMDTSIRIYEDLMMNFYLFRQCKVVVYEDVCCYNYALRSGSAMISRLNEHKLKDPLRVQQFLYQQTEEIPEWNECVERRMMYQMITNATMWLGDQKDLVRPYRKEVRQKLRQRVWKTLGGKACRLKLKIMVLWTAIWPWSYAVVHSIYAKISGVDKAYVVE